MFDLLFEDQKRRMWPTGVSDYTTLVQTSGKSWRKKQLVDKEKHSGSLQNKDPTQLLVTSATASRVQEWRYENLQRPKRTCKGRPAWNWPISTEMSLRNSGTWFNGTIRQRWGFSLEKGSAYDPKMKKLISETQQLLRGQDHKSVLVQQQQQHELRCQQKHFVCQVLDWMSQSDQTFSCWRRDWSHLNNAAFIHLLCM